MEQNSFYDTIVHLRQNEEVVIFSDKMQISKLEERLITDFLRHEYQQESTNYPHVAPEFSPQSALWAAKLVYSVVYLHFFRHQSSNEVISLLRPDTEQPSAAQMLSADIVLRFLFPLYLELKNADPQDLILPEIEKSLKAYHYSAIGTDIEICEETIKNLFQNLCFKQLYLDRVAYYKLTNLSKLDEINKGLKENFGKHVSKFWLGL